MFPNKVLQKVSTAEILQNARVGTTVHCLPEWQAPVWVLTGFACYSLKSYSPVGTPRKIPLRNTTDKSQWFLGVGHEKRRSKASFSDDMEVT